MPALNACPCSLTHDSRPGLGHVNLMADTLIANANIDDLRAIVRTLLATSPPSFATAFAAAARTRLQHTALKISTTSPPRLFFTHQTDDVIVPTPALDEMLSRVRSLYGAGMGIESLPLLTSIVTATFGLRWRESQQQQPEPDHHRGPSECRTDEDELSGVLAVVDADISQAIQSSKEQFAKGQIRDVSEARDALDKLRSALQECLHQVEAWGGEFPFEKGYGNANCWKL